MEEFYPSLVFSTCLHVSLFVTLSRVDRIPSDHHTYRDLDRSNLGNARLQGLPEDVLGGDPTGLLFDWLVASFFVPYVSAQLNCHYTYTYLPAVRFCARYHGLYSPSIIILECGLAAQPFYGAYAPHRW